MANPTEEQLKSTLLVVSEGRRAFERGSVKTTDAAHAARLISFLEGFEKDLKSALVDLRKTPEFHDVKALSEAK